MWVTFSLQEMYYEIMPYCIIMVSWFTFQGNGNYNNNHGFQKHSVNFLVTILSAFMMLLLAYMGMMDNPAYQNCTNETRREKGSKPCAFDLTTLGDCYSPEKKFGYDEGKPCIFFKMNKVGDCFEEHSTPLSLKQNYISTSINISLDNNYIYYLYSSSGAFSLEMSLKE